MSSMDGLASEEILKKAKGYALRLFKLRPRSEAELKAKIEGKGYPRDVAERIASDFMASGYIDDEAFARLWMQSRLKKYGFRRVSRELALKGISKDMILSLREELINDFDEVAVASAIIERRARFYLGLPDLKGKKRAMDYLARRGFSGEAINKAIRDL